MRILSIAVLLCLAAAATAQSMLPATPLTAPAAASPVAPLAAAPTVVHGHRALVGYRNGLLQVRADNSSLNVILRDVARLTGMKITGGVADQRVFGSYGPAAPGTVLATLLDGTGVNILLHETPEGRLASLTLTPRQPGGITPPSPDSHEFDEEASTAVVGTPAAVPAVVAQPPAASQASTPTVSTPPSGPQPLNNVNGSSTNTSPTASTLPTTDSVPIDSVPTPSTTPPSSGIVDAPNPPPPGTTTNPATTTNTTVTTQPDGSTSTTTTTTSPNGVKTPEQIYQQLLDMQKNKAAAGSGNSGGSSQPQQ